MPEKRLVKSYFQMVKPIMLYRWSLDSQVPVIQVPWQTLTYYFITWSRLEDEFPAPGSTSLQIDKGSNLLSPNMLSYETVAALRKSLKN